MGDQDVMAFENVIMRLKSPLLDATDVRLGGTNTNTNTNTQQDIEGILNKLTARIDELYAEIKNLIENKGVKAGDSLKTNTLNQVFLQNGVNLSELCKDPQMKDRLLTSLNVLLKEYPLTRGRNHVFELLATKTEAPKEIIPNTEQQ
jgi:hypothetical protein